ASCSSFQLSSGCTFCIFFFQAEDGIRDFHVTGVQTCALPISGWRGTLAGVAWVAVEELARHGARAEDVVAALGPSIGACCYEVRSEERRVGKEWRWRWPM